MNEKNLIDVRVLDEGSEQVWQPATFYHKCGKKTCSNPLYGLRNEVDNEEVISVYLTESGNERTVKRSQVVQVVQVVQELTLYKNEGFILDELSNDLNPTNGSEMCLDLLGPIKSGAGMIRKSRKVTLLETINVQSTVPEPSDEKLLFKFEKEFSMYSCYTRTHAKYSKRCFTIKHFAGEVMYNVEGFIDKNIDSMPCKESELFGISTFDFMVELGKNTYSAKPEGEKRKSRRLKCSTAVKFKEQIKSLVDTLDSSQCSFVRCIKPNRYSQRNESVHASTKHLNPDSVVKFQQGWFDRAFVVRQLRCLNVPSTAKMLQRGLPARLSYATFLDMFNKLKGNEYFKLLINMEKYHPSAKVAALLHALRIPRTQFRLGATKVFFTNGTLAVLNKVLTEDVPEELTERTAQAMSWVEFCRIVNTYSTRFRYRNFVSSAQNAQYYQNSVKIQRNVRMFLRRKGYKKTLQSAAVIEKYFIYLRQRRIMSSMSLFWNNFCHKITSLQCCIRMYQAKYLRKKRMRSVFKIQRVFRRWLIQIRKRNHRRQSITLLQRVLRDILCNKKTQREQSAILIQRAWKRKGNHDELKQRVMDKKQRLAAIVIRNYARSRIKKKREIISRTCAAIILQRVFRNWYIAKHIETRRQCAILLQKWFRSLALANSLTFMQNEVAAVYLQNDERVCNDLELYKQENTNVNGSVLTRIDSDSTLNYSTTSTFDEDSDQELHENISTPSNKLDVFPLTDWKVSKINEYPGQIVKYLIPPDDELEITTICSDSDEDFFLSDIDIEKETEIEYSNIREHTNGSIGIQLTEVLNETTSQLRAQHRSKTMDSMDKMTNFDNVPGNLLRSNSSFQEEGGNSEHELKFASESIFSNFVDGDKYDKHIDIMIEPHSRDRVKAHSCDSISTVKHAETKENDIIRLAVKEVVTDIISNATESHYSHIKGNESSDNFNNSNETSSGDESDLVQETKESSNTEKGPTLFIGEANSASEIAEEKTLTVIPPPPRTETRLSKPVSIDVLEALEEKAFVARAIAQEIPTTRNFELGIPHAGEASSPPAGKQKRKTRFSVDLELTKLLGKLSAKGDIKDRTGFEPMPLGCIAFVFPSKRRRLIKKIRSALKRKHVKQLIHLILQARELDLVSEELREAEQIVDRYRTNQAKTLLREAIEAEVIHMLEEAIMSTYCLGAHTAQQENLEKAERLKARLRRSQRISENLSTKLQNPTRAV